MTSTPSQPVLLVSAPFGPLRSPSLGLSLLQACLAERGIGASIRYLTLDFARTIGPELYVELTEGGTFTPDLVGEWIFGEALNGRPGDVEGYLDQVLREGHWAHRKHAARRSADLDGLVDRILGARAQAGPFLDRWAERLVEEGPKVVGFTSVFQQNAASLALAARIKALDPGVLTAFGGANAEGAMGQLLFERFPALDLVVSGEGETRFPEAMAAFLEHGAVPEFEGTWVRPWLRAEVPEACPSPELDRLPWPDYGDYDAQLEAAGLRLEASVPFETSRGCWWGARQHCTFCGLNGASMAFRSKSQDRALAEFRALRDRYPGREVSVVDNILDLAYFEGFLPSLAEEGNPAGIFYEVKANLGKAQLRLLKAAGVTRIQPGIESLSDPVLRLMRKGVKAIHCVQLLKWCAELGIQPGWNLLAGFPGEDPAEYARMAALVPRLSHLPPPAACGRIRLDRFSPNFDQARELGLVDVHAYPSYGYIYELPQEDLDRLAYHFAFRYPDGREVQDYLAPLEAEVERWRAEPASLVALDRGDQLLVFDTRAAGGPPVVQVSGPDAWVLRACDGVTSLERLGAQAAKAGLGAAELAGALARMEAAGLLLVDGGLALTLPLGVGRPAVPAEGPLQEVSLP